MTQPTIRAAFERKRVLAFFSGDRAGFIFRLLPAEFFLGQFHLFHFFDFDFSTFTFSFFTFSFFTTGPANASFASFFAFFSAPSRSFLFF
ncbi:MAG: hypothetical protein IPP88_11640 [Betaproteobacteria bacterium]|nr:hypothetical protein [Betaproteobacteria bacterium]